jgi:hypothetical protein
VPSPIATAGAIALDDGHRESTQSSFDLLRGCKRRGMAAPVLPVGDGAPGVLVRSPRGVPREPR